MKVVCPICDSRGTRLSLQLERLSKKWNIYGCGDCLTEFVYPIPPDEELEQMYNWFYTENLLRFRELLNPNYGRLSFPRQWGIIKSLVKKRGGKILDFGCGGGHFLSRVSSDWQKYGVDISGEARVVAKKKGVITFEALDDLREFTNFFDVIVMFATIEHLPNPKEVVRQLSKLLKVGGLFVVMTGDVRSVKAISQGRQWHLYTPPGHLFFFSAHSVDWLMGHLGFRKVKHLYTDGGVTQIPFMPLNMMLRVGIEVYHRIPVLNRLPLFDTYYGYYRKEAV